MLHTSPCNFQAPSRELAWNSCPFLQQHEEFVPLPGAGKWHQTERGICQAGLGQKCSDWKAPEDVWVLQGGFKMKSDQVFNASIGLGSGSKLLPGEALI